VVWETIGGAVYETLFKHMRTRGRLVIVGSISGYKSETKPEVSIANLSTQVSKTSIVLKPIIQIIQFLKFS